METYYVTQEQLDFINTIYEELYSIDELLNSHIEAKNLFNDYSIPEGNAVLRYLGGDTSVEFKVKEQLYRLWATDQCGDKVYFKKGRNIWSTTVTEVTSNVFEAPLEEIKKWKTPAWEIEEVN